MSPIAESPMTAPLPDKEWLSVDEVAAWLGCSKPPLYQAIKRKELKASPVGRRFRIRRANLFAYLGDSDPAQR